MSTEKPTDMIAEPAVPVAEAAPAAESLTGAAAHDAAAEEAAEDGAEAEEEEEEEEEEDDEDEDDEEDEDAPLSETHRIAEEFAALCEAGRFAEAGETFWAEDVVSLEPMDEMAVTTGKEAVRAKGEWWAANHEVHEVDVDGPYVNGDQFALVLEIEVTPKATGERIEMEEIALYTLRDGKIVEERFLTRMG